MAFASTLGAWGSLSLTLATGATLFVRGAWLGFSGAPSRCLQDFVCYCEATANSAIRQPVNTWSSFCCIPVALFIVASARSDARAGLPARGSTIGILFAHTLLWQGFGSALFHASLTVWGAVLDAVGLTLVALLVLLTNLVRLGRISFERLPVWLLGGGLLALAYRLWIAPVMAPVLLVLVIGVLVTERVAQRREAARGIVASPWFRRSFATFGVAALAWGLSLLPGFPLCSTAFPYGHAVWHALTSVVPAGLWLHARTAL